MYFHECQVQYPTAHMHNLSGFGKEKVRVMEVTLIASVCKCKRNGGFVTQEEGNLQTDD